MKWSIIFILFVIMQFYHLVKPDTTTLRVDDRVRLLKEKLRSSLRHKHRSAEEKEPLPDYYDSDETAPIKPILLEEILKNDEKFKLRRLKTQSPKTETPSRLSTRRLTKAPVAALTQVSQLKHQAKHSSFALDIFYRKSFDWQTEVEWMHCSELVTPYIKGARDANKWPKKLGVRDPVIVRLLHLLSTNTTSLSRAEKRSIMYQISKIQIRMYTWDINAMYTVLSRISKNKRSDFVTLKYGIKALFAAWNTDLSNTTALLLQARIFRPPCFPCDTTGSSKFIRGSTLPTLSTPTRSSDECDGNDNC